MLITLSAIFVLILLSAFFSGSETALTAASRPLMHQLENNGNRRAEMINRLNEHQERLIGAILLGNNLVNILASALATSVMIALYGEAGVAYATLIMTLLLLIFAEILPSTWFAVQLFTFVKMLGFICHHVNVCRVIEPPRYEMIDSNREQSWAGCSYDLEMLIFVTFHRCRPVTNVLAESKQGLSSLSKLDSTKRNDCKSSSRVR